MCGADDRSSDVDVDALEQLTPRGVAGVAVYRVRGAGLRRRVAEQLFDRRGARLASRLSDPADEGAASTSAQIGVPLGPWVLRVDGVELDEVLWVERPDGDAELHTHGSIAVQRALASTFGIQPVPSEALPFAERLLRGARSEAQLALALEQRGMPSFDHWLESLRGQSPAARAEAARAALQRTELALALSTPMRLALVGAQNAGKSTLFNRLVFAERVLAGPLPGLTRDPVAEQVVLGGYPYELLDTAGERLESGPSSDPLDDLAIELGRRARRDAAVLELVDAERAVAAVSLAEPRPSPRASLSLRICSRIDRVSEREVAALRAVGEFDLYVSALEPEQAPALRATIGEALRGMRSLPVAPAHGVGGPVASTPTQVAELRALGRGD